MTELLVIGLVIYFIFQLFSIKDTNKDTTETSPLYQSMIELIAITMKADGQTTKNELNAVKRFLLRNFQEDDAKKILILLREALKEESQIDIRPYCIHINQNMSYQNKVALLSLMFQIAVADGKICNQEAQLIQMFARFACIQETDFYRMKGYYTYDYHWTSSEDNRSKRTREKTQQNYSYSRQNPHDKEWAFRIFGLPNNASDKDIKKKFRLLAQQYHPDKQIGASEEEIKKSTEKFREINEAYELLTK